MKMLDYSIMPQFLERYFSAPGQRAARLVGKERSYDSGYYNIVRFFGADRIDPDEVAVRYRDDSWKPEDPVISKFARAIEAEFRREGRLYEGPRVTAVTEEQIEGAQPYVAIQPCDYGTFAGSCLALDRPDESFRYHGGTLREYYRHIMQVSDRSSFPLPGCLGVCGLLVGGSDAGPEWFLTVRRAGHLTSLANSHGGSAAGMVDFIGGYQSLGEMARAAMAAEVTEELGLANDEYEIVPLAWAREIFRGEKPQLFFLLRTGLSPEVVRKRLDGLSGRPEFDQVRFLPWQAGPADLNHEAVMNFYLAEEFFAAAPPG